MMKILMNAGHGYSTPGKRTPDGMKEYEFNRVVARYAKEMLEDYKGVDVLTIHSDKRDVPLQERTDYANKHDVDCYVSIHANAFGSNWNSADGIETFVYTTKPAEAMALAKKIQAYMIQETGRDNRGVKTANFHELRETNMTAVLVECGFMTNKTEANLLKTDSYRKKCAEAIVRGLVSQYNLKRKPAPKPEPKPASKGTYYRVVTGSFSNRKNADDRIEELKKKGFDSFIDVYQK